MMTPWIKCPSCALNYPPSRRASACPHAALERSSVYLDELTAKARAEGAAALKHEPWRAGENERDDERNAAAA